MATDPLEARQVRLGKNQALFRAVNEQIEHIAEEQTTAGPLSFLCECANPRCGAYIELAHGEYEAIRQNPTRFFVRTDHVFPEVETIVDYVTIALPGGDVTIAWDTRQALMTRLQHVNETASLRVRFTAVGATRSVEMSPAQRVRLQRALVDWSNDGMPAELDDLTNRLTDEVASDECSPGQGRSGPLTVGRLRPPGSSFRRP
jgi:hypothetical protein